jgi:hypothetical protein
MRSGQQKSQLVAEGRLAGNGPGGTYDPQLLSLACPCQLASGGCSTSAVACDMPSNLHGANRYDRATGRLEIVVGSHTTETFVEVRTMPVVAVSLTLSTSVDDFYRNKAAFLSSLASVLGIDLRRITIVDVVPGSRRTGDGGRRMLAVGAAVSLEIVPDPVVGFAQVPPTLLRYGRTDSHFALSFKLICKAGVRSFFFLGGGVEWRGGGDGGGLGWAADCWLAHRAGKFGCSSRDSCPHSQRLGQLLCPPPSRRSPWLHGRCRHRLRLIGRDRHLRTRPDAADHLHHFVPIGSLPCRRCHPDSSPFRCHQLHPRFRKPRRGDPRRYTAPGARTFARAFVGCRQPRVPLVHTGLAQLTTSAVGISAAV